MKKVALLLFTLLIIFACKDNSNDNTNQNSTTVTDNNSVNSQNNDKNNIKEIADSTKKNGPVIDKPVNVTTANFSEIVIKSDKVVLVDFWAQWCGPCKMIAPTLKEIAREYAGKVIVAKVDIDNNQELAATYSIQNIPTLLYFKNGKNQDVVVGANPKQQYVEVIERLLNSK